jgi:hypothetical protein
MGAFDSAADSEQRPGKTRDCGLDLRDDLVRLREHDDMRGIDFANVSGSGALGHKTGVGCADGIVLGGDDGPRGNGFPGRGGGFFLEDGDVGTALGGGENLAARTTSNSRP